MQPRSDGSGKVSAYEHWRQLHALLRELEHHFTVAWTASSNSPSEQSQLREMREILKASREKTTVALEEFLWECDFKLKAAGAAGNDAAFTQTRYESPG